MEFIKPDSGEAPEISIIIPSFNGSSLIQNTCAKTVEAVDRFFTWEIIAADDGSTDNTWEIIKSLRLSEPRIKGIRLSENRGQQEATFYGMMYASGKWIITMDDDLQHNPADIIKLYRKALEGYELVFAYPSKKYGRTRKAGSFLRDIFFYILFRKDFSLKVTSFRIMSDRIKNRLLESGKRHIYISAAALRLKPETACVTTDSAEISGSRYSFFSLARLFFNLLAEYSLPDSFYSASHRIFKNKAGKHGKKYGNPVCEILL